MTCLVACQHSQAPVTTMTTSVLLVHPLCSTRMCARPLWSSLAGRAVAAPGRDTLRRLWSSNQW